MDSFHIFSTVFLASAIFWCVFWGGFNIKHAEFYESVVLIVFANLFILVTSGLIAFVPSLIHNEYHGIQSDLELPSILINFFALVSVTLFRLSRQKLMNPVKQFSSMAYHAITPFVFLIIVVQMDSYGMLTSLNFSLVFDISLIILLYAMIVDVYECEITTILNKYSQALPLKLFLVNELLHLYHLLEADGHRQGGDEIRLMIGYIVMLFIINLTYYAQVSNFIRPRKIRTSFTPLH